ncbi:hypothetical protein [Rhizobium sp. WL3]|uniref:hypothetical protein n=1 Tax=Rhizobium sp. WL3 TaxID=2603277 RepID=UPI00164EF4E1|nr:hypothetical protein [Rhizobium sp. WL3]
MLTPVSWRKIAFYENASMLHGNFVPSYTIHFEVGSAQQTTMTMSLEMQVEELRAEMKNACDANECRQIAVELEPAQAALAAVEAEQDVRVSAKPPF